MSNISSIGFVGFGNMATAIFEGIKQSNIKIPKIYAFRKSEKILPKSVYKLNLDNLLKTADVIILAIKPQQLNEIAAHFKEVDLSKKCIISIMAGTKIKTLTKLNKNLNNIIRVMPNTAASIQESVSIISVKKGTNKEFITFTESIFESIGSIQKVDEEQMNFATAMFGSGPAFIYKIMEDLINICNQNKINKKNSELLIKQLFFGTSKLAQASNKPIQTLIKEICSPNGTTEAGLKKLKELNLDISMAQIIDSAENRAKKLSNE